MRILLALILVAVGAGVFVLNGIRTDNFEWRALSAEDKPWYGWSAEDRAVEEAIRRALGRDERL